MLTFEHFFDLSTLQYSFGTLLDDFIKENVFKNKMENSVAKIKKNVIFLIKYKKNSNLSPLNFLH